MDAEPRLALAFLFATGVIGGAIAFGIGFEFRSGQTDEPVYASDNANPSVPGIASVAEPPYQEPIRQVSTTSMLVDGSGNLSPNFISKIEPVVVEINCYSIGNRFVSSGSGISFRREDGYYVSTNFHVYAGASLNGKPPIGCFAVFPQPPNYSYNPYYGDYAITLVNWRYNPGIKEDSALFLVGEPFPKAQPLYPIPVINDVYDAVGITQMCSATVPGVGDRVTIFGYPKSGNALGISETVTEGIISGVLPGPIYKTTAAIDHGNSGGIAILNKNGCSLGIPTGGVAGLTGGIGYIQSFILADKS